MIADRLERMGAPLVALGCAGEQIGAGRIAADEETWQKDVRLLAAKAKAVMLLPATSPGTGWEIDLILGDDELRRKVFILVPPETSLLGDPGTMGGWSQPGAAPALTAFGGGNVGLLRQALGEEGAHEPLAHLDAPVGAMRASAGRSSAPGTLRDDAIRALMAHGIELPYTPPDGAIITLPTSRAPMTVRRLLQYRTSWLLIPGRSNQIVARLTDFSLHASS